LDGLHVGIFDGLERFFHFFHAYAVIADLTCFDQVYYMPNTSGI
jgi:hypothetical protein